ncbi:hypothetical protein C8R41DRAFT_921415 [Lentinula lateritia]|uniref:Uncharacterized protein n=1 Tax=Lentinula lateritia TaxID=40482 RepID=A0ABQ8VB60_9AGAR|nr:hypothetical protein C8R41DRAFT_872232 [Lentinula lateritia]KAJ4485105.1 hypothetical protein C8R41DRAFT_921415 [Lentinula lateritia]
MFTSTNTSLARVIFREIILAFYITDGTSTDPPPPSLELSNFLEDNAGTLTIIMGLVFCLFLGLALIIKTIIELIRLTYAYVVGAAPWVKDDELHKEEQAVASNELDTIQTGSIFEDRVDEQEVEMELLWE